MTKKQKISKRILIVMEALLLCGVLVFSVFSIITGKNEKPTVQNNHTENFIGQGTEHKATLPGKEETMAYEEVRLTFSDAVEAKLASMTIEEKVAQLFVVSPEVLTGVENVTISGTGTRNAINQYPVGGILYSNKNFKNEQQIKQLTSNVQNYSQARIGLPLFTMVGEEGGINRSPVAVVNGYEITLSPGQLGSIGDIATLTDAVNTRMAYLKTNGFNMILGAMGNLGDGQSASFDDRTYGRDCDIASELMSADITATNEAGMTGVLRYFPSVNDTGEYDIYVEKELGIFRKGIEAGAKVIMVTPAVAKYLTGDAEIPCCLSKDVVAYLRAGMGFDGLLMTTSLSDTNIINLYEAGEAAVMAVEAGMDVIFNPTDLAGDYTAVLNAVNSGRISQDRLHNSVGRILEMKMQQ